MTKATEARERARACRLAVHTALEGGPLTHSELQAALPDMQDGHLRDALIRLVRSDLVHVTGSARNGCTRRYELWAHITARLRDQARERNASTLDDLRTEGPSWQNARRIA